MSDKESAKLEINGKESPPNTAQEIITEKHILKLSNSKGDVCKNVVILLPGIEGDLSLMETISNNLQAEVWGAQYYQYHTVEEATKKLWPVSYYFKLILIAYLARYSCRMLKNWYLRKRDSN